MGQDHNGVTDQKTAEGECRHRYRSRSENLISVQKKK